MRSFAPLLAESVANRLSGTVGVASIPRLRPAGFADEVFARIDSMSLLGTIDDLVEGLRALGYLDGPPADQK